MGRTLAKRVLVENVSGGSGMIGTGRVARATADGYMVLVDQLARVCRVHVATDGGKRNSNHATT